MTDPPSGIAFHNSAWDTDKGGREAWIAWLASVLRECHRVLKPGGHALVWALPRTSHWTGTAIEEAAFEVRDCIAWHYGQGFPKSLDVSKAIDRAASAKREVVGYKPGVGGENMNDIVRGCRDVRSTTDSGGKGIGAYGVGAKQTRILVPVTKPATPEAAQWAGWGTALKPSTEFWFLARKSLSGTVAQNVLEHGTGAINIDEARIPFTSSADETEAKAKNQHADFHSGSRTNRVYGKDASPRENYDAPGRWPANAVFSHAPTCTATSCDASCPVAELDRQSGVKRAGGHPKRRRASPHRVAYGDYAGGENDRVGVQSTVGTASRFFYVAKATRRERNLGGVKNTHPTVKPIQLMRYLCRLITPPGGLVLDPFAGSGTTGCAAVLDGFRFIGIEREPAYVKIARRRLKAAARE